MKDKECGGHKSKVHSLDWNCDGNDLASGSTDHSIRIWSTERLTSGSVGKDSSELKGHNGSVDQLAWSPAETALLASVAVDKSLRLWDIRSMDCIEIINFVSENINLAWNDTGDKIAVASKDDTLSVIDMRTRRIEEQRKFSQEVNEMAWSHDGNELLVTRGNGALDIVAYPTLETRKTFWAHTSNCYCLQFTRDRSMFAIGSADAIVSLWDYRDMACIRTFCRLDWPIRALGFSHDGELIALASEDSFIDISFVSTGEIVHKLPITAAINTLAWHPKRTILAYAGDHTDPRTNRSTGSIYIFM